MLLVLVDDRRHDRLPLARRLPARPARQRDRRPGRDLPLSFDWPTGRRYLYAVTQGLHVNVGLVAIPFLLAKLWSVIPRLFAWPPVASPAQALERLSIGLLVASAVFEFVTGVMNIQYWYAFRFNFVVAHYYGAIVFVASLALHVVVKTAGDPARLPGARRRPLRDDLAAHPAPRGPADDLDPPRHCSRLVASPAGRWRCCWPTSARRSAGRCGGSRCSPRGAR